MLVITRQSAFRFPKTDRNRPLQSIFRVGPFTCQLVRSDGKKITIVYKSDVCQGQRTIKARQSFELPNIPAEITGVDCLVGRAKVGIEAPRSIVVHRADQIS